jgi:hypothetical protein
VTVRKKIRYIAIALLVVYSLARFLVVKTVLEGYGVNAWIFLGIDLTTSVSYVIGLEHLVMSVIHKVSTRQNCLPCLCGH